MKRIIQTCSALACAVILLTGCSSATKYKAGTYEGTGKGFDPQSPVRISVTIAEDGSIYQVNILSHKETPAIGGAALDKLAKTVVESNTKDPDTISGATFTSNGFREALKDALEKAK